MTHSFTASIFREYDIRGVVGTTLHETDAYAIGLAFAVNAKSAQPNETPTVCVCRDGRLSSPDLMDALCRGLTDSGVNVTDIGLGPTPMLYFAAKTLGATGGIMVTGSHNPPDQNGFKFVLQNRAFYGADIQALRALGEQSHAIASARGARTAKKVQADYLAALLGAYAGEEELRVAWDAGNGAAGEVMSALIAKLPGKHLALNAAIDGTFPAHHPDPTVPENLEQLIATVRSQKCDLGIAFDGDGDRIGVVDDEGTILWGDQLLALLARDVLQERPGATIIADVKASSVLFEEVARLGGAPLMWKTGHSLVKSKMAETGAPLAGEMSGHIFFADHYYGFDDALYAAVRVLAMLSRTGKPLSEMRKSLPTRINTPEIRFPCDDDRKFAVIEEVQARLDAEKADFSTVDGVRVNTPDGWWLLRASNTQPMLVVRCESQSEAGLAMLKESLKNQLALSKVALP